MNINDVVVVVSPEMKKFFCDRTNRHIDLVRKYAGLIADEFPQLSGVVDQAAVHDDSKFKNPEYLPYIFVTWNYKCKDDGVDYSIPDHIDDTAATSHHVKSNRHHPEFHDPNKDREMINKDDRDSPPDEIVDGSGMSDVDVAEMVADWCAMSEERGNSPKDWADKNVNIRWKFNDGQVSLIYGLIDSVWRDCEG